MAGLQGRGRLVLSRGYGHSLRSGAGGFVGGTCQHEIFMSRAREEDPMDFATIARYFEQLEQTSSRRALITTLQVRSWLASMTSSETSL